MNITILGLNNPDVNRKGMQKLFCYMTLNVSLFLVLYKVFLLKSDVPRALKIRLFQKLL